MFNRENAVGFLFLGVCAVVAGVMVYFIVTGERPTLDLPPVLTAIVFVLFIGAVIAGFMRGSLFQRLRGGQGGKQWPDPGTGSKSLWDRLRGK